jgi:membrane protease YdiL (CAAX protease family)
MAGDRLFAPYLPALSIADTHTAPWKTLLASLYGGIVEEILMRLFLMSLIAWIIAAVFRITEPIKNNWVMWSAIIITAILFGLGHLPVTASLIAITPLVVTRAIVLNGIGGIVFGWLYWKKGLLFAMVAHGTTDIVLLTVLPLLMR